MADIRVHIESLDEEIATRAAEGRDRADLIALRNELRRELRASESHVSEGDDPTQCHWYFDDGEESYSEYLPHDFSGDGHTCVNCHVPEPAVTGNTNERNES
jgi:hypothetical protein